MSSNEEIPPAQKARTIAHMNKDHRRNMRHILQHFGSVPPAPPLPAEEEVENSDPLMVDITLTHFTVSLPHLNNNNATEYCIAFTPPLASWDERRPRLVEMTRAAHAALGIADPDLDPESEARAKSGGTKEEVAVVVNEYMPPRIPVDITIFSSVLFYYACFTAVQLGYFAPGTAAAGVVEEVMRFPYGLAGFTWLVRTIFVPVLAIHVAETWWLERSRLRRFGVRKGSKVWWLWVGSVFIEGGMAFRRFDLIVQRLRGEKARKGL